MEPCRRRWNMTQPKIWWRNIPPQPWPPPWKLLTISNSRLRCFPRKRDDNNNNNNNNTACFYTFSIWCCKAWQLNFSATFQDACSCREPPQLENLRWIRLNLTAPLKNPTILRPWAEGRDPVSACLCHHTSILLGFFCPSFTQLQPVHGGNDIPELDTNRSPGGLSYLYAEQVSQTFSYKSDGKEATNVCWDDDFSFHHCHGTCNGAGNTDQTNCRFVRERFFVTIGDPWATLTFSQPIDGVGPSSKQSGKRFVEPAT